MIDDEKAERSRRYPSTPLREAVALLDGIYRGVGMNGGTRETLAHALGHASLNGTSKRKIAALLHYGLLEKEGERYRVSDIGRRILIPMNDAERDEAIADAVRKPGLFQAIGMAYDQEPLPSMLANVIAREHKVMPQASSDVATIFIESVDYAGLLEDGILRWTSSSRPADADREAGTRHAGPSAASAAQSNALVLSRQDSGHSVPAQPPSDGYQDYTIALDNRGKKATIYLHTPVTLRDLDRLGAWVGYMKTVIDEDEVPDVSSN